MVLRCNKLKDRVLNKRFLGILTVLAFVGSFLLASYFSNQGISLHAQLNKTIHWVESLFGEDSELDEPPANNEQANVQAKPKEQYHHVEVGNARACKDTSLGEVEYKKVGEVYTWVDERGIANFSRLPYDFNQRLTSKLNKLFEIYGQLLDRSSLKKVDINLRVYASKVAFNQVKAKHNMPISDNTPGFYSHGANQAHLLLTSHAATMRTAIHEAAHAINRGIIGYSPKWLNEGLAEYSEYIEVKGKSSRVYPNKNWTSKRLVSAQLLPLDKLLAATNGDWNSELRSRLYATSWAFIYFMMDNPQRKAMLAKVIKYEQQNLCDVTDIQQVEMVIGMPTEGLKRQFSHWSNQRLRAHNI